MVPPITSVCALMAKWPKPPPGSGFCPAQISASRSEAASAASVPSILSVGLTLIEPSNAAFIGLPAMRSFRPVRLPASAAAKSPSVSVMSSGSSCQTKRPVAPKLLEIDGQASENCTSVERLGELVGRRCAPPRCRCRCAFRRMPRRALRVRLLAARQRLDQAGPVGLAVRLQIDRDGRPLQRHVGDLDAADQQREKAQARGQPLGGERRLAWRRRAPRRRS